jgi:hypothetical protein
MAEFNQGEISNASKRKWINEGQRKQKNGKNNKRKETKDNPSAMGAPVRLVTCRAKHPLVPKIQPLPFPLADGVDLGPTQRG